MGFHALEGIGGMQAKPRGAPTPPGEGPRPTAPAPDTREGGVRALVRSPGREEGHQSGPRCTFPRVGILGAALQSMNLPETRVVCGSTATSCVTWGANRSLTGLRVLIWGPRINPFPHLIKEESGAGLAREKRHSDL